MGIPKNSLKSYKKMPQLDFDRNKINTMTLIRLKYAVYNDNLVQFSAMQCSFPCSSVQSSGKSSVVLRKGADLTIEYSQLVFKVLNNLLLILTESREHGCHPK